MKLEKAIEILEHDYQAHHDVLDPIPAIAIKLGIEALKRLRLLRLLLISPAEELLSSETKE